MSGCKYPQESLEIVQARSTTTDVQVAVEEIATVFAERQSQLNLVFFSDEYDLAKLGEQLQTHLSGPVVGCTSSGQLSETGFEKGGINAASLTSPRLKAIPYLIHPLSILTEQAAKIALDVQMQIERQNWPAFGFLLADGLSYREESLAAALYRALGDVPIFGGSAGDMLKFQHTHVYHEGKMYQDAAVFTLFMTSHPFYLFKHQHIVPSETRLVITEADPVCRVVKEINGEPAVTAYADLVGVPVDRLNARIFSRHPLLLQFQNDYYVRSIADARADGSLTFYCAMEKGLVLSLGRMLSEEAILPRTMETIEKKIGEPALIIGCDCVLRRLEQEQRRIDAKMGRLMAQNKVFGFCTYGEQFNSLHVNQTFTGVAIAGEARCPSKTG